MCQKFATYGLRFSTYVLTDTDIINSIAIQVILVTYLVTDSDKFSKTNA